MKDDIAFLSIKEIRKLLSQRKIGFKDIFRSVKEKIEEREKTINAFISLFLEEAEKEVDEIERHYKEVPVGKPLLGIPMAIKDNICIKDRLTTCGSKILSNFLAPYDATVIEKLKNAGAVIIGKTNMDEFAMGSSSETSYYGEVRNPLDEERVPGGSSGGSAAVVAYGGAIAALGSDTGGSVRQPAAFCGLYGFRPTYGRVSRFGLVAFASSLDTIGPIARTPEDTFLLYRIIGGWDKKDSTSIPLPIEEELPKIELSEIKIGVIKECFEDGASPEITNTIYEFLKKLKKKVSVVKEVSVPIIIKSVAAYYLLAMGEASSNLARYDGFKYGYKEKEENLEDWYRKTRAGFGKECKRRIMLGTFILSKGYYDEYYNIGVNYRNALTKIFEDFFEDYDFLITPTSSTLPFKIGERKSPLSMYLSDIYTVPAALCGIPALNIPIKNGNKLPIGLQVMGPRLSDAKIIGFADVLRKI